jgi:hypothetical protein
MVIAQTREERLDDSIDAMQYLRRQRPGVIVEA